MLKQNEQSINRAYFYKKFSMYSVFCDLSQEQIMRLVSTVTLVLLAVFSYLLMSAPNVHAAHFTIEMEELGTHPSAATQSTNNGKKISSLKYFNSRVFMGYGDYNDNTGPIQINPYNVNTDVFEGSALTFPSESVKGWRTIRGKLYTTMVDPTCGLVCPSGYAEYDPDANNWQLKTPVSAVHIYDIVGYDENELWLFGADNDGAAIWRSIDDGDSWTRVRSRATIDRYYWGAVLDGKVFAHSGSGIKGPVESFDGSGWSEETLAGQYDAFCGLGGQQGGPTPVVFNGKMICRHGSNYYTYNGDEYEQLPINAGTALSGASCSVQNGDHAVTETFLYILCSNNTSGVPGTDSVVLRTRDLVRWDRVFGVPNNASALDVDETNDTLYIGTTDAKLYSGALPASILNDPNSSYCFDFDASNGAIEYYYAHEDNNQDNPPCAEDVVIPSEIGGAPVRSVRVMTSQVDIKSVIFPDTLTEIGAYAFGHADLSSVVIPDSVVTIGNQAFYANNLTSVTIGSSVQSIGDEAFSSNLLQSVHIPNSVNSISETAFELNNTEPHIFDITEIISTAMQAFADPDNPTEEEMNSLYALLIDEATEYYQSAEFVRLYTEDVSNPNNLTDSSREATLNDLFGFLMPPGIDLSARVYFGGHLVNPAQITLRYEDESGNQLLPATVQTGEGIGSYSVSENLENDLTLYYRIGQSHTFTAPSVTGYQNPQPHNVVFASGENSHTFIYKNLATQGVLASTGSSRTILLTISIVAICAAGVVYHSMKKCSLPMHFR